MMRLRPAARTPLSHITIRDNGGAVCEGAKGALAALGLNVCVGVTISTSNQPDTCNNSLHAVPARTIDGVLDV